MYDTTPTLNGPVNADNAKLGETLSPLVLAMNAQTDTIDRLAGVIDALGARLQKVRTSVPSVGPDTETKDADYSPIVSGIHHSNARIQCVIYEAQNILNSLEV